MISSVFALPASPHAFYGKIDINDVPIADGYIVTAKVNGIVTDSCKTSGGVYGSGEDTLIATSSNTANVEFYIGPMKIGQYTFKAMEITKLDFSLTETPEYPGIVSDGICSPNTGECLFNYIDCAPGKTNVCSENGRCDREVGETCINTPEDCKTCDPTCSDGIQNQGETGVDCGGPCGACSSSSSSGGGSSSSSSGGGSSSSSSSSSGGGGSITKLSTNLTQNTNNTAEVTLEIQENNQTQDTTENIEETQEKGNFLSGITGAVVGGIKGFSKSGLAPAIVLVVVMIVVIMIVNSRKKEKIPTMSNQ